MLAADYNAEMIEQVERFPRVRDRAIFVGDPVDILPGSFGPGLPPMREWIESRFEFSGHILGFDPATLPPRETLRAELGWEPHERVVLVTVGGSGVGEQLLRRACEALPALRERVPNLRLVAVAGPSIDPATLPSEPGLDVHAYVHELHRLLAGCDVAVVQGGLSTGMELIALGRPFISIPLRRHFEQQLHVRHRLDRHGADVRLDYEEVSPERIAVAVAAALETEPAYAQPRAGAAGRAAASIAQLL
jgi:predicted glycosyltransferase